MPPIENNPVITNKINELWENVTTVDTFFAKRDPTDEECEQAAQVWEEWWKCTSSLLSIKMVVCSIVMPRKREEGVHEHSFAFGTRRWTVTPSPDLK